MRPVSILALPLLAASLVAQTGAPAPDPAAVVRAHRQLANLYLARQDLGMAEIAARTTVAVAEDSLGTDDPRTADAYASLGEVLVARGNRTGATAAYGQAVISRRAHFLSEGWTPGGRARQAVLLRDYAQLLDERGDTAEAADPRARAVDHERAADQEFKNALRQELKGAGGPAGPPTARRRQQISVVINGRELQEYDEDAEARRGGRY